MKKSIVLAKKSEIQKMLKKHTFWAINSKRTILYRTFTFPNQIDALAFIARVVVHSQVLSHYPEIQFSFGKVKITLSTNEVKGLTKNDLELLERIDHVSGG
jgi:4a-hydroxytetrahydrobiopterin dehydratase